MTNKFTRLILVFLTLLALPACALESKYVFHSLEFGGNGENQGIEVLDWRYGDSKLAFTHADKGYLATGHIPQGENASAAYPVGDSLYVKWRVQSTGKVYEDTVDLKSRLPSDMENKIIHFAIKEQQLYIYVIEGISSKDLHKKQAHDCQQIAYKDFKCSEIYPEHWANF